MERGRWKRGEKGKYTEREVSRVAAAFNTCPQHMQYSAANGNSHQHWHPHPVDQLLILNYATASTADAEVKAVEEGEGQQRK